MKKLALLFLIVSALGACTKPKPIQTEFDLEMTADDAFNKVVNELKAQNLSIPDFDPVARTARTDWKEMEPAELVTLAVLPGESERYERGRLAYQISIQDRDGKAHVKVAVTIQGMFRAKQAGTGGGGGAAWSTVPTKGAAEQQLIAAVNQ